MERLVEAGEIRFPALSSFAVGQVTEAHWIAAVKGYTPATVTQPIYNLLARSIEQEYLPMCPAARNLYVYLQSARRAGC